MNAKSERQNQMQCCTLAWKWIFFFDRQNNQCLSLVWVCQHGGLDMVLQPRSYLAFYVGLTLFNLKGWRQKRLFYAVPCLPQQPSMAGQRLDTSSCDTACTWTLQVVTMLINGRTKGFTCKWMRPNSTYETNWHKLKKKNSGSEF